MFCSKCGQFIGEGLNFCKSCGAKVSDAKSGDVGKLSESAFITLVSGIIAIPIAGLGVVIGLMSVMKESGFSSDAIFISMLISFALLLAAEVTFIWLLWSRTRTVKETVGDTNFKENAQINSAAAKELGAAQTRDFVEPISSITEHETRPLETIRRESKAE